MNSQPLLLAYDGSDGAKHAIKRAAELFGGGRAHVVTAWSRTPAGAPWAGGGPVYLPEIEDQLEQSARETAEQGEQLARELGFDAEVHIPADAPLWRAIVNLADEVDAAAIVVGARGLSDVKSFLIGSVSNAVLHHTTRPVLVVHAP